MSDAANLDAIDDAFEYLVNKYSKGEKGQYFTLCWVIGLCVKMSRFCLPDVHRLAA